MKKKLTLAIAAYVLLVAGILTYIYCPRTVIKIQQCGMKKISQYQYFVRR